MGASSAAHTVTVPGVGCETSILTVFKLAIALTVALALGLSGGTALTMLAAAPRAGTPGSTPGERTSCCRGAWDVEVWGPVSGVVVYGTGMVCVTETGVAEGVSSGSVTVSTGSVMVSSTLSTEWHSHQL